MTFTTFTRDESDCRSSSGVNSLAKHIVQGKHDRFYGNPQGETSKLACTFRSIHPGRAHGLSNEIFHQKEQHTRRNELDSFQKLLPVTTIYGDWVCDFTIRTNVAHHSPLASSQFEDFEHLYRANGNEAPLLQSHWKDEFQAFCQQASSSEVSEEEHLAFEHVFEELDQGERYYREWDGDFRDRVIWESLQQHTMGQLPLQRHTRPVLTNINSDLYNVQDWANEFDKYYELNTNETRQAHVRSLDLKDEWIQQYQDTTEEKFNETEKGWDRLQPDGKLYGYRTIHKKYETYNYMDDNPYLGCQDAIEDAINNTLADAIMALEAKTQLNPNDAKAWEQLGLKQQENERDSIAITALEKAVSLDSSCLDAWLALSVSYANEHCRMDGYNCLEQWIAHSPKYKHILQKKLGENYSDEKKRHIYITQLFLEAARSLPGGEEMDADVQVGLGVLFNISEEYSKAVDCFKAALITRPHDYQLWNKVGATLANSHDSMGAIEMYINALEINPLFVRARYNLAISCMNMGQYEEAAQYLLTSLSLQRSASLSVDKAIRVAETSFPINGTNGSIWDSLRLLMYMMRLDDLAAQCNYHNLDAFHSYFDF